MEKDIVSKLDFILETCKINKGFKNGKDTYDFDTEKMEKAIRNIISDLNEKMDRSCGKCEHFDPSIPFKNLRHCPYCTSYTLFKRRA